MTLDAKSRLSDDVVLSALRVLQDQADRRRDRLGSRADLRHTGADPEPSLARGIPRAGAAWRGPVRSADDLQGPAGLDGEE